MEISLTPLFVLTLYPIFSQWNSVLVQAAPELFQCRICQSPHVMGGDEAENHLAASHGTTMYVKPTSPSRHDRLLVNRSFRAPITCSTCGWSFAHIGRFASHHLLQYVYAWPLSSCWTIRNPISYFINNSTLKKPCHQCGINFANASERFAHLCDRHGLTKENGHLFK